MGTRGYKIIRFRGRYYCFYNHWDSYPDCYGAELVSKIPKDPEGYRKWLVEQRVKASKWDSALENFLHVKRLNAEKTSVQELVDERSDTESEVSEGALLHWSYNVGGDVEELPLPSYQPRLGWIDALAKTYNGKRLLLPDLLPKGATTSLVVTSDPPNEDLIRLYEGLNVEIVTPKGINGFHPTQRHEPLFCARIFQIFQRAQKQVLAHLLLGWKPDDLPFREIAFSILCLASGRQNVSLVEDSRLAGDDAHGSASLMSNTDCDVEPEFVAHMGVGAHLNDNPAGSAPDSSMYWFEGVLVHLVARLDNPGVVPESVARVVRRARECCPRQPVDAVLISIAHIVLVRVSSRGRVQHTKSLPLFVLRDQPCQDPRDRFSPSELQELLQRKRRVAAKRDARAEKQARQRDDPDGTESEDGENEGWDSADGEEGAGSISFDLPEGINLHKIHKEITKTEPSFFSLAYFLDSSTRTSMLRSASGQGCFPTEIYRLIIQSIEDVGTHGTCMAVSSDFRKLCLQNTRIIEGWDLLPTEATMAYTHAPEVWNEEKPSCYRPEHIKRWRKLKNSEPSLMPGIRVVELAAAALERDITIDRVISTRRTEAYENIWRVVVGKLRHRRSVLLDVNLGFRGVERHLQE